MTSRTTPRVLIVGAGIGGLTAALALLQQGFEVRVLERAGELREVGAGVQLSANAVRVLYRLGIGESLRRVASEPVGKYRRLWNTGETWRLLDFSSESTKRYGFPYLTLYRADLHRVLADAVARLAPASISLGSELVRVSEGTAGVTAEIADGSRIEGDVLIGADGIHSVVREQLIAADRPTFSGCVAWRGVVEAAGLPEHLRRPHTVNWMGPRAHVMQYPLRRGELVNFVGVVEKSTWPSESWTAQGSIEECLDDFEGWHEDVRTLIRALGTPFVWALMVREPLTRWTNGVVTLLGDAAHPTLPFLSQGAAMAIEDGYILARGLARHGDAPARALLAYQAARIERTTRIVLGSAENLHRFHNPTLEEQEAAAAYMREESKQAVADERHDWIFSYDVDDVPI